MYTYGGAYTYLNVRTSGDTGAAGEDLWAYTVQFGNGVSYTLSLEDPAAHSKVGTPRTLATTSDGAGNSGGFFAFGRWPPTANSASPSRAPATTASAFRTSSPTCASTRPGAISASRTAIHDASGAYYGTTAQQRQQRSIRPRTKYGWAFSPRASSTSARQGDSFGFNFVYDQGRGRLCVELRDLADVQQLQQRSDLGWAVDGVFGNGTAVELTKAWSINAGYQHIWGPAGTFGGKWRTTVYGGYVSVSYDDDATALINSHCSQTPSQAASAAAPVAPSAAGNATFTGFNPLAGNSCSPNFSFYQVGTRTQFNPHPLMDIGLDVIWTHLNTAYKGPVEPGGNGSRPACINSADHLVHALDDQNVLSAIVRWQRNFYP